MFFVKETTYLDMQHKFELSEWRCEDQLRRINSLLSEARNWKWRYEELKSKNEKMEKDKMSDTQWTTYHLTKSRVEIVRKDNGKFLEGDGFDNIDDAVKRAEEIVKSNPSLELFIYTPVKLVTATIPVEVQDVTFEKQNVKG